MGSQRTAEAYRRIWAELDQRGIPYTLHWGQCLRADAAFIRQSFGERVDAWLAAQGRKLRDFARSGFYSDSHNDLPLLELVTHPVTVDPDEKLAAEARRRGWPVISLR